jgi:hypothetical protein
MQPQRPAQDPELSKVRLAAEIELRRLESSQTAKESASKYLGKHAIAYIVVLVLIGVGSLAFLPPVSHAPVIGLVAGGVTALIAMLQGIVGTADKAEKPDRPEVDIIKDLVARLDKKAEPMSVEVDKDKVTVKKGDDNKATFTREG